MASSINAITTGTGGVVTTGDSSGVLNLQSGGTTRLAVTSTGVDLTGAVTGTSFAGAFNGSLGATTLSTVTATTITGSGDISNSGNPVIYSYNGGTAGTVRSGIQLIGSTQEIRLLTANTTRATIDTSGNLGLGVTPSAWSQGKAIEVGYYGNGIWSSGNNETIIQQGAYYNAGWKYATAGQKPVYYSQYDGGHTWFTSSATGTVGNAVTFTQAMTLNANGNLALLGGTTTATGVGITFPATQSASTNANTLDDYEEGSWTPAFTESGGVSPGVTYSNAVGRYTKVGSFVHVQGYVSLSSKGTASGTVYMANLPFANSATANAYAGPTISLFANLTGLTTVYVLAGDFAPTLTKFSIYYPTGSGGLNTLPWANILGTFAIEFNFTYQTT